MTIEEIIKEAFSRGWNASHECATDFDYDCALNGFLSEVETEVKKFRIGAVSGSFSMDDVKDLLWYGETRDLKVILKENPREKGDLDIALGIMFDLIEQHTYLDRKKVEDIFWNRLQELVNYR